MDDKRVGFCYNNMMDLQLFQQLGASLVLATLIGLEREQVNQKYNCKAFAGIRTYALIGLLGALSYILSEYSIWLMVLVGAGIVGLLLIYYFLAAAREKMMGATSEVAVLIVYIVGVLCAMDRFVLATVVALLTFTVLHFKDPLHKMAKHLKRKEVLSTVQFIVIAFVILPILPNVNYGPYEFFNPYIIWLMVVFISGISFVSYILIKVLGAKRGIGITGFLAGLVSSTALTMTFSGQSKKNKKIVDPYVVAVVVASSAMFFRILIEVLVLNPDLFKTLSIPMLSMGFTGLLSILYFWFKKEKIPQNVQRSPLKLKSPFSLGPALKFGLFFALILFLVKFSDDVMGEKGIYLTSLVSGIVDVDAITLSMAKAAKDGLSHISAITAITIAAITNTIVKGGIFFVFGNRRVAFRIMAVFMLMLFAGGISLIFVY